MAAESGRRRRRVCFRRSSRAQRAGEACADAVASAFRWLEGLDPPVIAAPPAYVGRSIKNFVPNNDLDAVGGDPARIGEIRTAKIIRPRHFDAASPLLYAWTFERGADADRHAQAICEIADDLYQLGRGVDMAWAQGETLEDGEARSAASAAMAAPCDAPARAAGARCFRVRIPARWRA